MKKILLVAAATLVMGSVQANPFDALGCSSCHGAGGKSASPAFPSLAKSARPDLDVVKALKDFQSGARNNSMMTGMSKVAIGHEQAIADYLAGQ